jgi:hypothetical protein
MRHFRLWSVAAAITLYATASSADVILTADGETVTGHEATVVDGVFQVPGEAGAEPRSWPLSDLQRINFGAARPTGELKTRFVRLELPGNDKMLHVGEVQVFVENENVALKGKATQSSTWETNEANWGPQKAIDGNTGGVNNQDGITHTLMEANPWWEVDLAQNVTISKVVVWNRTDNNCGPRLAGFRIALLDENRTPIWTRTFPEAPNPSVEVPIPARGDAFSEDDLKAFDAYAGSSTAGTLLNSLANWLSGKPATQPAATPPTTGATPAAQPQPASPFPDGARLFQLSHGGRIAGKLQKWTEQGATIEFTIGGQTATQTIPTTMIREVLAKEIATQATPLDRSQISTEADTVYAKVEGGATQTVAGTVKGVEGESLLFEFQGKPRKINLSRVLAIIRHGDDEPQNDPYAVIELRGGQRVPGKVQSLAEGRAVIETLWKEKLELPRGTLMELSVRNGRVTSLTELEPAAAEYVPYLDRRLPHTVNESLNGQALQIGDAKFDRGLCTHSRTLLTYDLGPGYARLRTRVGLQKGDGDRGNVVVRVLSDGAVLFEKQLNGGLPPQDVDVDTSGKKSLTLEVDFGDEMDIGDHVVWGDPVLVRGRN